MKYLLFLLFLGTANALFAQIEYTNRPVAAFVKPRPVAYTAPRVHADCVDPLCKMKVAKGTTLAVWYRGKEYGFCSAYCRDLFKNSPAFYLQEYVLTGKSIPHNRRLR